VTVNATGAGIDRLLAPEGIATGLPLLKAMNLVTRRAARETAIGGRSAGGRHFFLVPWRNRALFGTWESAVLAAQAEPTESEVASFIAELNQAFPGLRLARDEVTLVHRGLVPATSTGSGGLTLASHDQWRDHAPLDGVEGLVSIAGTKYTTARALAERVTDRVLAKLRRPPVACRTASTLLPGGEAGDVASALARASRSQATVLPDGVLAHLVSAYGARQHEIATLAANRPEWRTRLADDSPVIGAELVHAVREEMAITLIDAVVRRTPLGALGFPGEVATRRAADIVAEEAGWSEDRARQEIAALEGFYAIR
jgi:glycerol-3-phosphate dehydrogenase